MIVRGSFIIKKSQDVHASVIIYSHLPYEEAAEYHSQYKDKYPCAKNDHIDVERKFLRGYWRHDAFNINIISWE